MVSWEAYMLDRIHSIGSYFNIILSLYSVVLLFLMLGFKVAIQEDSHLVKSFCVFSVAMFSTCLLQTDIEQYFRYLFTYWHVTSIC